MHVLLFTLMFNFRIAQKREDAVTREMTKKFSDDKKMTRKERDERLTSSADYLFRVTNNLVQNNYKKFRLQ